MSRLPKGFREGHDGSLKCPHRDLSCCPDCAKSHVEVMSIYGREYWVSDPLERSMLKEQLNANPIKVRPWRMEGKVRGANIAKVATTARMVAEGGTAEAEANARLIAAAPDLLAALVSIARYAQVDLWAQDEWEKACEVALAAIAKARGTP